MEANFIYADEGIVNSSAARILIPAKHLTDAGHTIQFVPKAAALREKILETVVVEREIDPDFVAALRSLGAKRIICTFDDAYHLIPPHLFSVYNWWKGPEKRLQKFRQALKQIDLSIVPSKPLAEYYGAEYVPNFIDDDSWKKDRALRKDGKVLIGWGGSTGHKMTWQNEEFLKAIKRVVAENKEVEFHLFGNTAEHHFHAYDIPFIAHEWCNYLDWPFSLSRLDIGIAPLNGQYDMFRSNLKLVEMSAAGVPWVASELSEYVGATGGLLVPNNFKDWYRALTALVKSKSKRMELAADGEKFAARYMMSKHVRDYENILWPGYKPDAKNR